MNKSLGIIPFVLSITVSILVIFGSCFSQIAKVFHTAENVAASTGAYPLKEKLNIPVKKAQTASAETKKDTASVQVNAQKGDAVGKIYEQFLSPYSQKLNYSGIYIKNSAGESLNIKNELSSALELKIKKSKEPEVLIVHTHATESYMNEDRAYYTAQDKPRNEDDNKNVVKVGETFAEILRNGGISVLHDKTHHDSPSYNQSYSRAKTTINEYLSKYPSIKVVVDVHRDSIAMTGNDKCKPTAEINGKKAEVKPDGNSDQLKWLVATLKFECKKAPITDINITVDEPCEASKPSKTLSLNYNNCKIESFKWTAVDLEDVLPSDAVFGENLVYNLLVTLYTTSDSKFREGYTTAKVNGKPANVLLCTEDKLVLVMTFVSNSLPLCSLSFNSGEGMGTMDYIIA